MLRKATGLLKGLNMNVVVSNQAVLEKNSPLLLTSLSLSLFFFPCNQPVCLLRKCFSCQPLAGWEWGAQPGGDSGARGKPHSTSVSTSREGARGSYGMWSDNHLVLDVRGRVLPAPWENWAALGFF